MPVLQLFLPLLRLMDGWQDLVVNKIFEIVSCCEAILPSTMLHESSSQLSCRPDVEGRSVFVGQNVHVPSHESGPETSPALTMVRVRGWKPPDQKRSQRASTLDLSCGSVSITIYSSLLTYLYGRYTSEQRSGSASYGLGYSPRCGTDVQPIGR